MKILKDSLYYKIPISIANSVRQFDNHRLGVTSSPLKFTYMYSLFIQKKKIEKMTVFLSILVNFGHYASH